MALALGLGLPYGKAPARAGATCTRQITDSLNRKVAIAEKVERVVDLAGVDGTRTLVTLGAEKKLVGVNSQLATLVFGQTPRTKGCWFAVARTAPQLKSVMNVGNFRQPATELIASLAPDVVLARGTTVQYADALQAQTGIPVVCIRASGSLDFRMLDTVARITGTGKRARDLIAYAGKKIRYIREKTAEIPLARRVKVFYWTPPTTGAPRTIAPYDPIDFAGGINLGAKSGIGPGRPFETTKEQVAVWNPDVILLHWWTTRNPGVTIEDIARDPVLQTVTAVKNNRVFYSKGFMFGWDPVMGLCELYYMARLFYPGQFKTLDVEAQCNEILETFYKKSGLYTDLLAHSALHRWESLPDKGDSTCRQP